MESKKIIEILWKEIWKEIKEIPYRVYTSQNNSLDDIIAIGLKAMIIKELHKI